MELVNDGSGSGGGGSTGGEGSEAGAGDVKSFSALRYGGKEGVYPVLHLAGLLRTHFFTMLFLGVFFSSVLRRRCRCW